MVSTNPAATGMPEPASPTPASLTEHDSRWLSRALELAQRAASIGEVPVGAVVYETGLGKLLGEGANRREIDADPAAHAEVIAIREAARARRARHARAHDGDASRCHGYVPLARSHPAARAMGSSIESMIQGKRPRSS